MGRVSADQLMKHITDAGGSGFQVSLVAFAIVGGSGVRETTFVGFVRGIQPEFIVALKRMEASNGPLGVILNRFRGMGSWADIDRVSLSPWRYLHENKGR